MADLPRVTAILQAAGLSPDLSAIDPVVLEAARARGSAIHEALEGIVYGFDVALAPDHQPYVAGYRRFCQESGFTATACEFLVEHTAWGYRGHADLLGFLGTARAIVEVKTGMTDGGDLQCVAYGDAWTHARPDLPVTAGGVLVLTAQGRYRYEEVDFSEVRPVWLAAVTLFHAKTRRNGGTR